MSQPKGIKNIESVLLMIERGYSAEPFAGMIAGAYALWLAKTHEQIDIEDLPAFLNKTEKDNSIRSFLLSRILDHWKEYRRFLTAFNQDEIQQMILDLKPLEIPYITELPDGLCDLVERILDIRANDSVADFGVGYGRFLCHAFKKEPAATYWGDEIGTEACAIAKIRGKLLGGFSVDQEDMFASPVKNHFDKAFCYPPFGMRFGNMPNITAFLDTMPPSLPQIKGTVSCEWLFALKMISCLKKNGKGVLLMSRSGLHNISDSMIRKYILERRKIEAIIQLPARVLDRTAIPPVLVVFRDGENADWDVRMIDASDMGQTNRRNTVFTKNDVDELMELLAGKKNAKTAMVDSRDMICNGNLCPTFYVQEKIDVPFKGLFGDTIKSITKGAAVSARKLDELISEEETPYCYLSLKSINEGFIDDTLPFLKGIDESLERYTIPEKALLISRFGSPIKIAIAESKKGKTIIGSENIFIITIDETVADPYYLKAFLESPKGMAILNRAAKGAVMPNLSIEALDKMEISLPPLEQQKKIASQYLAKMDEIAIFRQRIEKAKDALKNIIDF